MQAHIIIFSAFIFFFFPEIPLFKLGKREMEDGCDGYKALCHLDVASCGQWTV